MKNCLCKKNHKLFYKKKTLPITFQNNYQFEDNKNERFIFKCKTFLDFRVISPVSPYR